MRFLLFFILSFWAGPVGSQSFKSKYRRSEKTALSLVNRALKRSPVIDGHNDLFIHFMDCGNCPIGLADYRIDTANKGHTDIPRLRKGRVGGILMNVFGSDITAESYAQAWDLFRAMELRYGNDFTVASSSEEMKQARKQKKIALLPSLEGAVRLENDTALLRKYYGWGLRAVTLAYRTNDLADGSDDTARHAGISDLGRRMVAQMNKLGVMIDLSHVSTDAMSQVLDISRAPVFFSHSNVRALCDVNRNVPDSILERLKANGGLIMLTFVPYFVKLEHSKWLDAGDEVYNRLTRQYPNEREKRDSVMLQWETDHPEPMVTVADMADQFDYVRRLIGVEHIGLAGDFDGISFTIPGLSDVSMYANLFLELARRGWSASDLRKIASENFLRVFRAVEKASLH